MLSTLAGQVILLIASPILTRLYSPTDYGLLALYSSLVVILSAIITFRYEMAILVSATDEDADTLARMGFLIATLLAPLCGIVLWVLVQWLRIEFLQPLKPYIGLMCLGIWLYGVVQILTYRLTRKQQFRFQMHSRWLQPLTYALTQLIGGGLRVGAIGLIAGHVASHIVTILILWSGFRLLRVPRWQFGALLSRYKQFPLNNVPSALISTLGQQLPLILSASLYSLKEAGWLALGLRVIATPIDLICTSLGQVYLGRVAERTRQDPTTLRPFVWRTVKTLFGTAIIPTLLLMGTAPALFPILFGEEWRITGEYIQLLAPLFLIRLVVSPIAQTLVVTGRLDLQLGWEIFRITLVGLSFWLPRALGMPFQVALMGYTLTYSLSLLILLALSLGSARDYRVGS